MTEITPKQNINITKKKNTKTYQPATCCVKAVTAIIKPRPHLKTIQVQFKNALAGCKRVIE